MGGGDSVEARLEDCIVTEDALEVVEQFAGYPRATTQSDQINELIAAASKAQGMMKGAVKEGDNTFFKSKYATLHSTWDACRKALCENGLAVIQTTKNGSGGLTLITTLGHSSGQWIRGEWPIDPVKNDPQGLISALTYARRGCLAAIVGVSPADDDDGEGAMGRKEGAGAGMGTPPKGETDRDVWGGPLKKTAFKEAVRAFSADLAACTDYETLLGLLNAPETMALLDQCQKDMPSWLYGTGGDVLGLNDRVDAKKQELAVSETNSQPNPLG